MAIMVMGTVEKPNNKLTIKISFILPLVLLSSFASAGEWNFDPNIGLTETYSDNVLLSTIQPQSSLVSQAIAGLDANYQSLSTSFDFSATKDSSSEPTIIIAF